MGLSDGFHIPAKADQFEFDSEVAEVFDNMAVRSLPSYRYVYERIAEYAAGIEFPRYSQVWDFGVSTGAGLAAVQRGARHPFVDYRGVDISDAMILKAKSRCPWAHIINHDLREGLPKEIERGNVAVAIFGWTLQFLGNDHALREALIEVAYDNLMPGGMLFIMEKFDFSERRLGAGLEDAYYRWRRDNGYTLEEIRAKSLALAGAMWPWPPDALEDICDRLQPTEWMWLYRQFNFGGIAIVK